MHSIVSNNDKLDYVKLFTKTILKEFEEKTKPELQEKLAAIKKSLAEEEEKYNVLRKQKESEY